MVAVDLEHWLLTVGWIVPIRNPEIQRRDTIGGLGVVCGCLTAGRNCNANIIVGDRFTPDISVKTSLGSEGAAVGIDSAGGSGVVLRGLCANGGSNTNVIIWGSLTPDPTLQTGVRAKVARCNHERTDRGHENGRRKEGNRRQENVDEKRGEAARRLPKKATYLDALIIGEYYSHK